MPQNRRPQAEAQADSSSEEEESSEENEEQEESESEGVALSPSPKKPLAQTKSRTSQISAHPQSSSSDDSEAESDSDLDSPSKSITPAGPNIKPAASRPMEEPPKATKKPRSKPSLGSPELKLGTTPAKRQVGSETTNKQELKRVKRKLTDVDGSVKDDKEKKIPDESKKQLFQRVWSEDDEIAILNGMIEYMTKKGADPVADQNAFHDFIKKSLHVDVSKTQLLDKIRRLKKKYKNNANKGKNGQDRTFAKAHEQKSYELSKKIWGDTVNGVGVDSTKVNGKARKSKDQIAAVALANVDELASPDHVKEGTKAESEQNAMKPWSRTNDELSLEEKMVKNGLRLITGPKKLELEEKSKKVIVHEVEHYLKQLDLLREQTKVVLEAMKSSEQ
ncbi:probable transcription factor At4g00390 [Diospyros lotus]|uniref:probable transcription factor At4g00390 n=1 Tax=Diospyros lotus TaxID=55363 RepID=UPI00224D3BED|nr:probable transcription factor At4g00390 [Diospyros lotus]XP_052203469.1 probable transcription factor At4g00390 [Diospyros lotus]XP_052203470.1 probable transcription factor At4g00390 [Diospyros lotus]